MTKSKTPGDVLDYAGLKSENEQLKLKLEALAKAEARGVEKFAAQQEEKLKAAALIGATHLESAHEFAALQARAFAVDLREGRV
ncbi:hypothetical protein [Serratia fonticola]|uniref:hypothetical protein n=1 Tax=Serratia fonticola TaxID=47917 RepID=UPI0034C62A19